MAPDLAIVTGASRGIGRAVVDVLLARGFEVVGVSRGEPELIPEGAYRHFVCDLADPTAVHATFDVDIPARVGLEGRARIGLVNNAGRLDVEPVVVARLEHLVQSMIVNVALPIWLYGWLLRHAAPDIALRIVDLSSGAATSPYPGWVSYCASKAALDMAGQVLGVELGEVPAVQGRDVALVSFAPGVVATAMQEQIRAADGASFPRRERFVEMHESGELIAPADPAAAIAEILLEDGLPAFSRRRFGS